jgi:hypothetical protein
VGRFGKVQTRRRNYNLLLSVIAAVASSPLSTTPDACRPVVQSHAHRHPRRAQARGGNWDWQPQRHPSGAVIGGSCPRTGPPARVRYVNNWAVGDEKKTKSCQAAQPPISSLRDWGTGRRQGGRRRDASRPDWWFAQNCDASPPRSHPRGVG